MIHEDRFKVVHVLTKPPNDWTGETGRITREMARKYMELVDDGVRILVCGPQKMALKSVEIMEEIGHAAYNIHAFGITDF